MKSVLLFLTLNLTLLLLSGCGGGGSGSGTENPFITISRGTLVSSTLLDTKPATFLTPYSVNAYKIIYETIDVNGDKLNASGLLSIPNKASGEKSPLLSYQHGTIFLDSQAPSKSASTIKGINTLSGMGYIVSAPDFIGYGESASTIHPYIHAETLASASLDMLRASSTFLSSEGINTNKQLFLVGYSEGGYATLALQKAIQESPVNEFTVTASAAGAGPFDLLETAKTLANQSTNEKPAYMSFLIKAYDSIYALNAIDEMYQTNYRSTINTFFDGQHSGSDINDNLSHTTADLFEAPFLSALQGTGSHAIKEKLALNNIYDWTPSAPTRFYHSTTDEIVPYSNAVKALETMQSNGAENVSLGDCAFGSHGACAFPYVLDALNFFSDFVEDL